MHHTTQEAATNTGHQHRRPLPWFTLLVPNVILAMGLWCWEWNIAHVVWQLFIETYIASVALVALSQMRAVNPELGERNSWTTGLDDDQRTAYQNRHDGIKMLAFVSVFYLITVLVIWLLFHVNKTPENSDLHFIDAQPMPSFRWFISMIGFFALANTLPLAADKVLGKTSEYRLSVRDDSDNIPRKIFGALWWYWMTISAGIFIIAQTQQAKSFGLAIIGIRIVSTLWAYWFVTIHKTKTT